MQSALLIEKHHIPFYTKLDWSLISGKYSIDPVGGSNLEADFTVNGLFIYNSVLSFVVSFVVMAFLLKQGALENYNRLL